MEGETQELKRLNIQTSALDLRTEPGASSNVKQLKGLLKSAFLKSLNKDISIDGSLEVPHTLNLSAFDSRVLVQATKDDQSPSGSKFEFNINELNLEDYFKTIVPISKIKLKAIFDGSKPSTDEEIGEFYLGKSRFFIKDNSEMNINSNNQDSYVLGHHNTNSDIRAKISFDSEVKGYLKVSLEGPKDINSQDLLARVWFWKPVNRLSSQEKSQYKELQKQDYIVVQ